MQDVGEEMSHVNRPLVSLHVGGLNVIISIGELDHHLLRLPDCAVIVHGQVLEALDQTALHLARLSRFNGRVDQTLTTRHGMKEELTRGQTREEGVLNEALEERVRNEFQT